MASASAEAALSEASLHVPLLLSSQEAVAKGVDDGDDVSSSRRAVWLESKKVLRLAVPISLSNVIAFGGSLVTTAQVGHLGSLELSAITLARSVFHVTGLSLVVGMASAVETFCGQAHGAGQHRVLGVVLQRAVLLCLLTACLPLALWARAEDLMLAIGQKPEVASLAARYVRLLGPALGCWGVSACIRDYLASQGVVTPQTLVAAAYTAAAPLVNHLCIYTAGWGMVGAAVAYNILQALELLLMLAAMAWMHLRRQTPATRTWGGFSGQALRGWGGYLKVALPSAAAICLDWWTYEAVILIAGGLPDAHVQLGAMGLAFDTHALLFMVVDGFSSATSTRVSNQLGAGHGSGARFSGLVALGLGVAAPLAGSGALLALPRQWAGLYTRDRAIIALVARLMPLLTVSNLADAVASVTSGLLRGAGRQELAFKVNLAAYWLLGLPSAALLALRYGAGAQGLWAAMGCASAVQASVLLGCVLRFDWPQEAARAQHRVAAEAAVAEAGGYGIIGGGGHATHAPGGAEEAGEGQGEEERAALLGRRGSVDGGAGAGGLGRGVPRQPLHQGLDSRHGTHEPVLTSEHVV
ncbi:hypothetical protein HYH03_000054 [Edaphochlamys debaryana]|uniref:Protein DETOXIFICATION n=1 Tax=Edaphochlamys debaryana TaxID=47281 RepID=A0A835YGV2_9CHLO|nr:hypothetical protein HYH03_000054 [Edaphochlamys debaryana]|eukprot:KAG2501547.1 hypothetical protein HYH03_000054 [Edaphochlamys debaryana]